jgi:predicted porin
MLKTKLLVASAIWASTNFAYAGVYVDLAANQFVNVDDFDDEQSFALSIGYEFNDKHAVELEYQVNGFDSDSPGFEVDADVITYMVNYDYTAWTRPKGKVYLGAGYGVSAPEFNVAPGQTEEDDIRVYNIHVGAEYTFNDNFALIGEVRYQSFDEFSENGVKYDVGSPLMMGVSVRYRF